MIRKKFGTILIIQKPPKKESGKLLMVVGSPTVMADWALTELAVPPHPINIDTLKTMMIHRSFI